MIKEKVAGERKMMSGNLIDISQLVQEGMPVYPGDTPYTVREQMTIAAGAVCNLADFSMSMHCGTHIDAPLHFFADGAAINDLELGRFYGKARVVEVDALAGGAVDRDNLAKLGIGVGDRVLLKIPANEALNGAVVSVPTGGIGLTVAAAVYLVERRVVLVGINCDSVENGTDNGFPVHRTLLAAGIPIVENLRLTVASPGEYYLACFPLKLAGGNGAPARAVLAPIGK
jgi:arylformamidase